MMRYMRELFYGGLFNEEEKMHEKVSSSMFIRVQFAYFDYRMDYLK